MKKNQTISSSLGEILSSINEYKIKRNIPIETAESATLKTYQ